MRRHVYILYIMVIAAAMAGCSAHKNTARSRFWQSFTAKYNTFYNGEQAFIDGTEEKEKGNKDNFTELLPLYAVGNKQSREIGKGNFDRTIEKMEKAIKQHSIKARPEWNKSRRKTAKDREWLGRLEYNPFLWKAWLLMGKAQFQKGAFDEAAATFSYMGRLYQTQPMQNSLARAWLAKCYVELGWIYDAEDVIRNMSRDSIHYRSTRDWDYTFADYYLRSGNLEEAASYLRKVIRHERRKTQKARELFLLGQVETALGHREEAYKAYGRVERQNPPYEVAFNARIAQTEVMAQGNAKKMISRLKRMARNDNNKDYLDQVYYAIGNIYLTQKDTLKAISAYEEGNKKATRSGVEKGVLLLTLGNLYWQREKYNDAQRCYGEAIGLLDKERPDYEELSQRSKVLDELVPYTDAIYLQDSLQQLAKMSEKDRLAAIDRVIDALKKKEKEERDAAREREVEQALQQRGAAGNRMSTAQQRTATTPGTQQSGAWYFYNVQAVNQGKQQFQQQWGRRENADNWQRVNKTVVNLETPPAAEPLDDALMNDSIDMAAADSIGSLPADTPENAIDDSLANDPHNREYYLAQIPFTEEQLIQSDEVIKDGLFHSGVIFKDQLDNLKLSEKQLLRLTNNYPDFAQMDEAWYHLFLLYSRLGRTDLAENCLSHLQADFPESKFTTLLSDPYFAENQRFGQHLEDSIYTATYEAFRHDRHQEISSNYLISEQRFPLGANRPKFMFVNALSRLNQGDGDSCVVQLRHVVEQYPESEVTPLAGMIVKGVQEGRRLHGGKFDLGDVWSLRDVKLTAAADSTIAADTLSAERNTGFVFLLLYNPDSLANKLTSTSTSTLTTTQKPENQLLYEMARYNFTNFLVRNFDLETDVQTQYSEETGEPVSVCRMMIRGFLNYDEALQYARQLYDAAPESLQQLLRGCRSLLVSEQNLPLIGKRFSLDDYQQFYDDTFLPLPVSDEQLLLMPTTMPKPIDPEDETPQEDEDESEQDGDPDFDLDFF